MPITARERTPAVLLNGDWEFQIGPKDNGKKWCDPETTWEESRMISVPHSWQEHEDLREYTGTAWYRRTFEFTGTDTNERALLSFGAVDYETTVWVNGERVGHNEGGYLPFTFDVTGAVKAGENTIVLRVHDPEDISEIPHGKQGEPWYTRVSGPWQRIDLLTVPETHVVDATVTPDLTTDTAIVELTIGGEPMVSEARVTIEREGTTVVTTTVDVEDRTTAVTLDIPNADYWTPESPALYNLTVELDAGGTIDTYKDYFGMRSISFEGGDLYLNGEPFAMRGALDQAFYPDTFYRPTDLKTFEREITVAKELGFNMLRKHIKPAHPEFIELADRLGMLVWEEPANPTVYTERSKELFREQLYNLIKRDFNSPSVVTWSIYNEEWGIGSHSDEESLWTDIEKQDYLETLYEQTRSWDPTRLVCDNSGWAHVATDLNDYHEYFVAPDRVEAWRERLDEMVANPAGNYGEARTDPEEAPLLVSEFGTWGLTNVDGLEDHYDGDPHWFHHDFLNGMKRPGNVREKFEASHAADIFEDLNALKAAWQRREFQSVETIIADMREHTGVAGYVLTELSDIEWEFNGVLDYLREEKAFHDDFARINAPVMLHLEPASHAIWAGEAVAADLVVVNDTNENVEFEVGLSVGGSETVETVTVDPHGSTRIKDAIVADAPAVEAVESTDINASVPALDRIATRSVVVVPKPEAPAMTLSGGTVDEVPAIAATPDQLAEALATRGYRIVEDHADADVSLVTDPADTDGPALVVPKGDGRLMETDRFAYAELPETESWNLCASFLYQNLIDGISPVPGWAFADLYPYGYVTDTTDNDDVSVGYMEGWLATDGAVVMTRGNMTVCTLRVTDAYGDNPVATAVVDHLIATLI